MRALCLVAAAWLTAGAAPAPQIDHVVPVVLHPGINRVTGFLPGGGTATIVEAWRGNGNAHGFHVWMVLTGPSEGNPVGIAPGVDSANHESNTIRDNPFDGERTLGSVRFARAMIGGKPASLVFAADLDQNERPLADHQLATLRVYRLVAQNEGLGPPVAFVQIATQRSSRPYCNADLALRDLAGIPLPRDFAGANRIDGCFKA